MATPSPALVEMVGAAGYDVAILDAEHALASPDTLQEMIRAAEVSGVAPWVRDLDLQWTPQNSRGVFEAILDVHRKMTSATGGRLREGLPGSIFRNMLTLHPLGGCRMGASASLTLL